MFLTFVAVALTGNPFGPIQPKALSRLVVVEGRLSDRNKSAFASLVSTNMASAKLALKQRVEARTVRNVAARARVDRAPRISRSVGKPVKTTTGKILERTDVVTLYIADVRLKVQNEFAQPVEGSLIQVEGARAASGLFSISSSPSFGTGNWTPSTGIGYFNLFEAKVPGAIKVKVTDSRANEWSLLGGEQIVPVTAPESEATTVRVWDKKQPRKFLYYLDKSNKQTTSKSKAVMAVYEAVTTRRVAIEPEEPIILRREVADFVIRIPDGTSNIKAFLGERAIEAKLSNGQFTARLKREEIGDSDASLVIQSDTPEGGFGCTIKIDKPNFYGENELDAKLVLESIPDGNVVLSGKKVDDAFPLSPIHWRSESPRLLASMELNSRIDERPRIMTGASALELLGIDKKAVRDQIPGPRNEKGRYGRWLWIDSIGLALHCRFDPDDRKAWKPMEASALRASSKGKYLPHQDTFGLLESIRVTTPKGGQIGSSVYVGASRDSVELAFGKCDAKISQNQLEQIGLHASSLRNRAIMGDESIDCWDDTYLNGGVRIKWSDDKIKWFEIARPIQLLFNGTRSFDPPEVQTIALKQATVPIAAYQSEFESSIRAMLAKSSGLRFIDDWENAEIVAQATMDTYIGNPTASQHSYVVDAGKKRERTIKERFLCPEVTVGVEIRVSLQEVGGELQHVRHPDSLSLGSSLSHTPEKQCVNDAPQSLRSLVRSAMTSGALGRSITNAGASFSDMTGTVLAVNWQKNLVLINLGKKHGIRAKPDAEMTEFNLYLLHDVDPRTGAGGDKSTIQNECILGRPAFNEWLEVKVVGEDWCVAQAKKKGGLGGGTDDAYNVLPRVMDPGSGLVRVTISKKSGG